MVKMVRFFKAVQDILLQDIFKPGEINDQAFTHTCC